MESNEALTVINQWLSLEAKLTNGGDEVKCWISNDEGTGTVKTYFNKNECLRLAEAFKTLAENLTTAADLTTHEV